MRAVDNHLEDDDGNVLGEFVSHWGACAAMLGEERHAVTYWDDLRQTVVPVGKLHRTKAEAEAYAATRTDLHDVRLVPEHDIPEDARRYFK